MIKFNNFIFSKDTPNVIEYFNDKGQYHRIDGPAVVYRNSSDISYFFNGLRHRVDGPAVEWKSIKEWWYMGKKAPVASQKEFEQWVLFRSFE